VGLFVVGSTPATACFSGSFSKSVSDNSTDFEADLILDVTLVLASDADKVARKVQQRMDRAEYMQWSTLNGALSDQSVLLMRIGDLIIAEWSHSGAIRFWDVDSEGALWLVRCYVAGWPGVLLADDMGLGKTLQSLTFLALLRREGVVKKGRPVLIVAPTSLLRNW
jgi:hypothetical protein